MGLLDEIKTASNRGKKQCKFAQTLDTLDKQDKAEVEMAMADPMISVAAVTRVLQQHGYQVSVTNCRDHHRGVCCCVSK